MLALSILALQMEGINKLFNRKAETVGYQKLECLKNLLTAIFDICSI
jgi:hypothetical protein